MHLPKYVKQILQHLQKPSLISLFGPQHVSGETSIHFTLLQISGVHTMTILSTCWIAARATRTIRINLIISVFMENVWKRILQIGEKIVWNGSTYLCHWFCSNKDTFQQPFIYMNIWNLWNYLYLPSLAAAGPGVKYRG